MSERGLPGVGLVHLGVIWVVWGSTYLAIRIAVGPGSGIGPFWLGASRVLLAGAILVVIARVQGARLRLGRSELAVILGTGVLMWAGGNGAVNWAEQRTGSGLVALVVGTTPLWVALIEGLLDRRPPSLRLAGSLVAGFTGLVVLTVPLLEGETVVDALGILVVLLGTLSWGAASIVVSRRRVNVNPLAMSGLQQLAGGVAFVLMAVASGEALPAPTPAALGAWAYLVVFGSLIAFTSYVQALRLLPTAVVMTYSYVNPVIAVALGAVVLAEPVTPAMVAGMALILGGVIGVFHDRRRRAG